MSTKKFFLLCVVFVLAVFFLIKFFSAIEKTPPPKDCQEYKISHINFDGRVIIFSDGEDTKAIIESCSFGRTQAHVIEITPRAQIASAHLVKKPPYLIFQLNARSLAELQNILNNADMAEKVGSDWDGGWEVKARYVF